MKIKVWRATYAMVPKEKKALRGPGVERLIYFDCALSY